MEGVHCPVMCGGPCDGRSCVMEERLKCALRRYYKYSEFRSGQPAGCPRKRCLATGSGKSCMFLAPLAISDIAMAVIISPLNGLMDEQVCAIYFGRMCTNWLLGITD